MNLDSWSGTVQRTWFIGSVPEVIERVQTFKAETLGNPAIPFPWPPYVPKPEALDKQIAYLLKVYEEGEDKEVRTGGELGRARNELKDMLQPAAPGYLVS